MSSIKHRLFRAALTVIVVLLILSPTLSQTTLSQIQVQVKGVILIVWDGVQFDHLMELLREGKLPNLSKVIAEGVMVRAFITDHPTWTDASTPTIVTGVMPGDKLPIPAGFTLWERLKDRFNDDLLVGVISGKLKVTKKLFPNSLKRLDLIFSANIGDPYAVINGRSIAGETFKFLNIARHKKFFLYIHLAWPDTLGHKYGENSIQYDRGIIVNDEFLGEIMGKLKELGIYKSTAIMVVTDHGFYEGGTSHASQPYPKGNPDCYTIFIALNRLPEYVDPNVKWVWDQNDIAPTVYALLQVDYKSFGDLRGYAIWDRRKGWDPLDEKPNVYFLKAPVKVELLSYTSPKIPLKPGDRIELVLKLTSIKWMPLRNVTIRVMGEASSWLEIDERSVDFQPLESKVIKAYLRVPREARGAQRLWIGCEIGYLSSGVELTLEIETPWVEKILPTIIALITAVVAILTVAVIYRRKLGRVI